MGGREAQIILATVLSLAEGVAPTPSLRDNDPCWSQGPAAHNGGDPIVNSPQPGRNDPCHCGSGRKFKKCCKGGQK